MENLRYLLVAIAALTLIMSVVSGVNPSYFAGLNAFADHEDEEEDDDNSGTSGSEDEQDEEDEEDESSDKDEHKLVQSLGEHSTVTLETEEEGELDVEIEDGDLDDGTYDVKFTCDSPVVSQEFPDSLTVTEGHGEFETDLALATAEYIGCVVRIDELSATFLPFNVVPDEEHDDEEEDEQDEEDEEDDDNSGRGSQSGGSTEEKRKERKERIVSSASGDEIHERHRSENAASPGVYKLGWNYTLEAIGTASHDVRNDTLDNEADATIKIDLAVWKSNRAIILLDVVGGTVEVENQTYTVVLGYSIYSVQHDAVRVAALAVNEDGDVFELKMRGSAVGGEAEYQIESGSVELTFEGSSGPSNNSFGEWELTVHGTVKSS